MKVNNTEIHGKVIECTEKLLLAYGIKGWNMDDLAAEAGLAKNTLYRIIGSKEALIEKIVLSRIRNNVESVVKIYKEESEIVPAIRRAIDQFVHNQSLFEPKILPPVYREYPAIEKKVKKLVDELSTYNNAFFKKGQKMGIIRKDLDPKVFMAAVRGIVEFYIQKGVNKTEFEKSVKKALYYLFEGILA